MTSAQCESIRPDGIQFSELRKWDQMIVDNFAVNHSSADTSGITRNFIIHRVLAPGSWVFVCELHKTTARTGLNQKRGLVLFVRFTVENLNNEFKDTEWICDLFLYYVPLISFLSLPLSLAFLFLFDFYDYFSVGYIPIANRQWPLPIWIIRMFGSVAVVLHHT